MKKVSTILSALLILVMNVGLTANKHYCGGHLASSTIDLGHHDEGCGMEAEELVCDTPNPFDQTSISEEHCCVDESLPLELFTSLTSNEVSSKTLDFAVAFVISYSHIQFNTNTEYALLDYSPPLLEQDVQVLFQSFLI